MPRWTETYQDQIQISKIAQEMPIGGIVSITLKGGRNIEGVLRRSNVGNNAGEGGWKYYGECEIETLDKQRYIIDYLDIESAIDVSSENKIGRAHV